MRGLFITATDTGVGKTEIACALLRLARASGQPMGALKPAQSGVSPGEEGASDAARLRAAAGTEDSPELVCPYTFEAPLAPAVAARLAGKSISVDRVIHSARTLESRHGAVLVEGAGGLLAPLTEDCDYRDLAARLGLPVLVIARAGLGTINHTLLTLEALRARAIPVLGVVLNRADPGRDPSEPHNAAEIERGGKIAVLADLPFVAESAARADALDRLLAGKVKF
jgi:dethiobiotin synthetase